MLQIIVDVSKGDLDSLCLLPFCLGRRAFSDGCLLCKGIPYFGAPNTNHRIPIGENTILADMWIEVLRMSCH